MGVDELREKVNAKFKGNIMFSPHKDKGIASVPRFSSGSLMLDVDSGGGWPRGRIIELFGFESSGKTAVMSAAMAELTNEPHNEEALLVDEEGSFDEDWTCDKNGVNIERINVVRSDNAEQSLDIVELATESGEVGIIGLDSVAALIPKDEADGSVEDSFYALTARLMGKACRKAYHALSKAKRKGKFPTLFFINQFRTKMNVKYGSPNTTTGGNALKYAASIRVELYKIEPLGDKDKGIFYGQRTGYTFTKNKTAPPLRKGEIDIITDGPYAGQIDNHRALFLLGLEMGTIIKSASWYSGPWLDKKLQGEDAVVDHLRTYAPSELNKFVAEIQKAYMGNRPLAFRFKKLRVAKTGKKAPTVKDEIPENVDPETGEILDELMTPEEPKKGKKQKGKGK